MNSALRNPCLVAAFCGLLGISAAKAAPVDNAVSMIAESAAAEAVQKSDRFARLAVLPFVNDRADALAAAVTAALIRQGIAVVDRDAAATQQVLRELGKAGSDLYDAEDAPQFGRRLVADAVLIGRVNEWEASETKATLAAEMKIVHTETGEIIWSNSRIAAVSEAPARAAVRWVVMVLVAFVVVTVVLFRYRRARTRRLMLGRQVDSRLGKAMGKGTSDEDIRNAVARSLQKGRSQLATARAELEKGDNMELLRALREVENDMDLIRKRVEVAEVGRPETMSVAQARATLTLDEGLLDSARAIEEACRATAEAALVKDVEAAGAQAEQLKVAVYRLRTSLDDRGDKLGGV